MFKKRFSYRHLAEAFTMEVDAQGKHHMERPVLFAGDNRVRNRAEITARKLRQKIESQRKDFMELKKTKVRKERAKVWFPNIHVQKEKNDLHFQVRSMLKIDMCDLPDTHESDGLVASYVLNEMLGLAQDALVPVPCSKRALVHLGSM
jgi:hypothetical protein